MHSCWDRDAQEQHFQDERGARGGWWMGSGHSAAPLGTVCFETAEASRGRDVARREHRGCAGAERSIRRGGSVRVAAHEAVGAAVLAATRVPKTELADPTLRARTTERLAERGARMQTQRPLADSFARSVREGRTGLPHRSPPWVHRRGRRPAAPAPGGPIDQRER